MGNRWTIELLGDLRVTGESGPLEHFRTRKTGVLLAYLACFPRRAHLRESLADRFWPDSDPLVARNNLTKELSWLRARLEPPGVTPGSALITDGRTVRLNSESISVDVTAFEAALERAKRTPEATGRAVLLDEALTLYHGELLPEQYDDWVLERRGQLAEAFFDALEALVALREGSGDLPGALAAARRGVALDPLRESVQQALIRLLDATGHSEAALRRYQELERRLRDELGVAPDPETRNLARRIATRLDAAAPAPSPTMPPQGYVPTPLTRFFGREAEIDRLGAMLAGGEARLVTMTGLGGSGKTRLAIEVARRLREEWPGAVWFVALGELADAAHLLETIRDGLRLPRVPTISPIEQVVAALAAAPALLILDGLEHLVATAAAVVAQLLDRVPSLTCLCTSRRRLDLLGEQLIDVPPLPVPADAQVDLDAPSVQLFVDRASAVRADLRLTEANAGVVIEICRRLEGIPLALELAAARSRLLTPEQILERLSAGLDLLESAGRNLAPRHRSLRTAMDWSYHMLSPSARQIFARLSVFRGGWTVDGAAAVWDGPEVLDLLQELRDSSLILEGSESHRPARISCQLSVVGCQFETGEVTLVQSQEPGARSQEPSHELRFRMLDPVREYAAEQLTTDEREIASRRHAEYYVALSERAEPALFGPDVVRWLARLEREHRNLSVALDWARATGATELGLRTASALFYYWYLRGHALEGRGRLEELLARPEALPVEGALRGKALRVLGNLQNHSGQLEEARRSLDASVRILRESGDRRELGTALFTLASQFRFLHDLDGARSLAEEARVIFEEAGDRCGVASSLSVLGQVHAFSGDLAAARVVQTESLCLFRETRSISQIAIALMNIGEYSRLLRDSAAARQCYEEAASLFHELDDLQAMVWSIGGLGKVARDQGDYPTAKAAMEEMLRLNRILGLPLEIAGALKQLGTVHHLLQELDVARALLEESLAAFRAANTRLQVADILIHLSDVLRDQGDPAAGAHYRETLELSWELRFHWGIAAGIEGFAALIAHEDPERATRWYGAASAVRRANQAQLPDSEQALLDARLASLRSLLADAGFQRAWDDGMALSEEQAVAEALADAATGTATVPKG